MSCDSSPGSSVPYAPSDSPGSSVSSRFQDEYEELLKYALVIPKYDPASLPHTLTDTRESFKQQAADQSQVITIEREPLDQDIPDLPVRLSLHSETSTIEESIETTASNSVESALTNEHVEVDHVIYMATIDPDIARMDSNLDQWCLELKRNVLAEFGRSKIQIVEIGRQQLQKERESFNEERNKLGNEVDNANELLSTYEKSIKRKDQVISNLTHALQKQKDRHEVTKKFCDWRMKHNDIKKESYASNLARKHHERQLMQRVWAAWHSVIQEKWQQRVERACQAKAQEVCLALTNDYEAKISALNDALGSARMEVGRLHEERDRYEETMKKAFMRGVCALNVEAMNMFQSTEDQGGASEDQSRPANADNGDRSGPDKGYSGPVCIPQEALASTQHRGRVATGQGVPAAGKGVVTKCITNTKALSTGKSKAINAKTAGKIDPGKLGYALGSSTGTQRLTPPMSSIVVERHQPVTKQTIGHNTASRFTKPQTLGSSIGASQRKLAGQAGGVTLVPATGHNIKLVE